MTMIRLEGAEEAFAMCDHRTAQKAVAAALKRTADSGRSIGSDEIRKVYNVRKSDVDQRIKVKAPQYDNLVAVIEISGRSMSLSYFGAKQLTSSQILSRKGQSITSKKISNRMRSAGPLPQGVMVQIKKGQDTVLLRNAFLAKMRNGHIGVYRRVGNKRLPIAEKNVISIASMAYNADVLPSVLDRIRDRWLVEMPRQLDYYMRRGRR